MKYIVIDIGSTYLKEALLDISAGRIIELHKEYAPQKILHEDIRKFEIPADEYVAKVRQCLDKYTRKYHDVVGLLLSTQMHGFIYSVPEKEDLYISWQDERCLEMMKNGKETYMQYLNCILRECMKENGVHIKPSLGLCNLYTMLCQDESIPGNGELYTLGSYIIFKLTGRNICHVTNAAPLGLLNVKKKEWNEEVVCVLGFQRMSLPKVTSEDFQSCGVYESNGSAIRIYPDYGDQQVAVLGSNVFINEGIINIATASQVSVIRDIFEPGEHEVRPFFEGKYLNTVSNMPSGRGLLVLVHFLKNAVNRITGEEKSEAEIWDALEKGFRAENQGIKVDMGFYATPDCLEGASGSIRHISPDNLTVDSLFTAAYENMAFVYWKYLKNLCRAETIKRIVCSGGVSWKNPTLIDCIAKETGKKCRLSVARDENMAGLYRIALRCEGILKSLDDKPELQLSEERR